MFSDTNRELNGVASARFAVQDVFALEERHVFDHIVFNTPWAVQYDEGHNAADVEENEAAQGRALTAVIERSALQWLKPHGSSDIFCVIPIKRGAQSVTDTLELTREVRPALASITVLRESPFSITRAEITARRLMRPSYILKSPRDGPALFESLKRRAIEEVCATIITVKSLSD